MAIHHEKKGQGAGFHLRSPARRRLEFFSELGVHFEIEDIHLYEALNTRLYAFCTCFSKEERKEGRGRGRGRGSSPLAFSN